MGPGAVLKLPEASVCVYVCMCVPVCKTVPTQAHTATCQGASGVCMFVFRCLQMHIYLCVCTWTLVCWGVPGYTHMRMLICMFVCLVYTHIHTHVYTRQKTHVLYLQDSRKANRTRLFIIILVKVIVSIPKKMYRNRRPWDQQDNQRQAGPRCPL